MKTKLINILILVLSFSLLTMLVSCNTTNNSNGFSDYWYDNADKYQLGGASIAYSSVDNLDVSWLGIIVEVKVSEDDNINFYEEIDENVTDDLKMRYYLDGSNLYIKAVSPNRSFNHQFIKKNLIVEIPQMASFNEVEIDAISAKINANTINAVDISFESVSGEIELNDINCTEFSLEVVSSRVVIKNIETDKADLETVSGTVAISEANIKDLNISDVSGRVEIKMDSIAEEINVTTVSGDVDMYLSSTNPFKAKLDTVSGDFSSAISTTVENGYYINGVDGTTINVQTVSGDFNIFRK